MKHINKVFLIIFMMFSFFSVNVTAQSSIVDNSKFINQSVPDRMNPGETYNIILTFENSGTTSWTPGDYKLRVTSASNNPGTSVWVSGDMDLVKVIEPGNTSSFEVKVTAPLSEGVYPLTAQLVRSGNVFGETNKTLEVTVTKQVGLNEALNSAAFVEQTIPSSMEPGKSYKIMISMTNTGKTSWTPGLYRLVMLDAAGNSYTGSNWSTYSVPIDQSITPGGTKVFNFDLTPILPGNYTLQWRMASSETGLFGDVSRPVTITVNNVVEEKRKEEGKRGKE